jgi:hypothetical protein
LSTAVAAGHPATSAQGQGSPAPQLHRDWAHPFCTRTGLTAATSAGGSPLPHLHQDWAHHGHICAGTGLTPPTSAPGLGSRAAAASGQRRRRRSALTSPSLSAESASPTQASRCYHIACMQHCTMCIVQHPTYNTQNATRIVQHPNPEDQAQTQAPCQPSLRGLRRATVVAYTTVTSQPSVVTDP